MKIRFFAALLIAALGISMFAGCTAIPSPGPNESTTISREDAIAIALKDAGLTKDQVTGLRAEFEYDDAQPEYHVEFRYDGREYDYEIHAETGKILSRDKDLDE